MNTPEARATDVRGIAACVVILVVGGLAINASLSFGTMGAIFPRTISILMMVLAATYIVLALRRPAPVAAPEGGSNFRRFAMFVVLLAWALLIDRLGFLTTSLICYMAALNIANYERWTPRMVMGYAATGGVILVGLFVLFKVVLQVPMPAGILI